MHISDNVRELQPSATLAVTALCRRLRASGKDVLDLSAGEPDFRTPEFAAQAGIAAIEQGFTQYTPVRGHPVAAREHRRSPVADYRQEHRSGRRRRQHRRETGHLQRLLHTVRTRR
jgi:aspartate/methionine/tyrosine aminotransferase